MSNSISTITLPQSLMTGLACAALNPGLRNILVFDASYDVLNEAASALTQLLEAATGKEVERILLGISELDDDLWGNLAISNDENGQSVKWRHGLLTAPADDPHLRLIVIPDLTKLSLAAARACVMLVGADVVHLERHSHQELWRPEFCWLVSCARSEVGSISPHLLDRFALRLQWQDIDLNPSVGHVDCLKQMLKDNLYVETNDYPLSPEMRKQIQNATLYRATLDENAIKYVLDYMVSSESSTLRREIALARIASAFAQLENDNQVKLAHVTAAAHLIGLVSIAQPTDEHLPPDGEQIQEMNELPPIPPLEQPLTETGGIPIVDKKPPRAEDIYEPDQSKKQDEMLVSIHPYPEDKVPVEREVASLQLPLVRYSEARSSQGIAIGVERSDTFRDLSVVSTILAAAPFQYIRYNKLKQVQQQLVDRYEQTQSVHPELLSSLLEQHPINELSLVGNQSNRPFLLSKSDLRRYRRTPTADLMLLILLDYTSLHHCDWRESLLPYLIKAYVERASICIVQVGMAGAAHELRADLVRTHSILVPAIDEALLDAPGNATPLAHGFDLVLQTLRHTLQHGRSTARQVLLIVVSDGRGNVPLEDSRIGRIIQPVHRKGVEDTLQIAQQLRDFRGVEKVLLNPQPKQYNELPLLLAEAMEAEVKEIPRPDRAGV
jgi:magnesium chelatase subunit D